MIRGKDAKAIFARKKLAYENQRDRPFLARRIIRARDLWRWRNPAESEGAYLVDRVADHLDPPGTPDFRLLLDCESSRSSTCTACACSWSTLQYIACRHIDSCTNHRVAGSFSWPDRHLSPRPIHHPLEPDSPRSILERLRTALPARLEATGVWKSRAESDPTVYIEHSRRGLADLDSISSLAGEGAAWSA